MSTASHQHTTTPRRRRRLVDYSVRGEYRSPKEQGRKLLSPHDYDDDDGGATKIKRSQKENTAPELSRGPGGTMGILCCQDRQAPSPPPPLQDRRAKTIKIPSFRSLERSLGSDHSSCCCSSSACRNNENNGAEMERIEFLLKVPPKRKQSDCAPSNRPALLEEICRQQHHHHHHHGVGLQQLRPSSAMRPHRHTHRRSSTLFACLSSPTPQRKGRMAHRSSETGHTPIRVRSNSF